MDIAQDPTRLRPMEISSLRTHSLLPYRPPVQPRRSSFGLGLTLETGLRPAFLRLGLRRRMINFQPAGLVATRDHWDQDKGTGRVSLSFLAVRALLGGAQSE